MKRPTNYRLAFLLCAAAAWNLAGGELAARAGEGAEGPRVGNGGGTWLCRDRASVALRWMEVADLFEARREFNGRLRDFGRLSYLEIYRRAVSAARRNPRLREMMDQHGLGENPELTFLSTSATLNLLSDGFYTVQPSAADCPGGYVYFVQLANFTRDGRLLINGNLWRDPLLNETNRAALLTHETVYKALREGAGDSNSVRARAIVAALFSPLSPERTSAKIEEILSSPAPKYLEPGSRPRGH